MSPTPIVVVTSSLFDVSAPAMDFLVTTVTVTFISSSPCVSGDSSDVTFPSRLTLFGSGKRGANGIAGDCRTFRRNGTITITALCSSFTQACGIDTIVGKAFSVAILRSCIVLADDDVGVYLFHTPRVSHRYKTAFHKGVIQLVPMGTHPLHRSLLTPILPAVDHNVSTHFTIVRLRAFDRREVSLVSIPRY